MRTLLLSLYLAFGLIGLAQNTGIGTPNPQGKLQINNNNGLRPSLLLSDSAVLAGGSIRWQNIATGKWMEVQGAATTPFSNGNALLIGSDSLAIASFNGTGRVGIHNNAPTEALDVNGNINLNGTIKVNGNDGTAGQVLSNIGSGGLQWRTPATTGTEENIATFSATTAGAVQTFTVPAGVTKIAVEAWGGGGTGGSTVAYLSGSAGGAGGGGGGYYKSWFAVAPGNVVNIVVGKGGTAAAPATGSAVTVGAISLIAQGGGNAVTTVVTTLGVISTLSVVSGRGGGVSVASGSFQNYTFARGADGDPTLYSVTIIGPNPLTGNTDYADNYQWGRGGNAGNSVYTGGIGGQSVGLNLPYHVTKGTDGGVPGGGGGGDRGRITNGGDGVVVVHY